MMEALIIEPTDDTPKIVLDCNNDFFEISSRSLPENAIAFFAPVITWLNNYVTSPKENSNFIFHFEYISTSSTKQLMKIILIINQLAKTHKVNVNWNYDKGDTDMLQTGERLQKLTQLEFIYKEI